MAKSAKSALPESVKTTGDLRRYIADTMQDYAAGTVSKREVNQVLRAAREVTRELNEKARALLKKK